MSYILWNKGTYLMQTQSGYSVTNNPALASKWKTLEKAQNVLKNCVSNNTLLRDFRFQVKYFDDEKPCDVPDEVIIEEKTRRRNFSKKERAEVYRKTKGYCYLCGDFVDYDSFEIEHKVPISKGGTNDISNLFCSCHICNTIKHDIYPEDFMKRISKIFMHQMENKYSKKMTWKIMSKKLHKMIGGN